MQNLETFESTLHGNLHPSLSSREMAEKIIIAALEAEYGKSFTITRGFDKMVNTLAEVLVTNPELRRQALSVASLCFKKNRDHQKSIIGKRT